MSTQCKCVIWDLDNTVWDGVCLEGPVQARPEIRETISTLRERGIIHSVASRGEMDVALQALEEQDLAGYFLVPKINWLPKPTNILGIVRELNLSLDAVAFVDDDPFECEQVAFMLPGVRVVAAGEAAALPGKPDFSPEQLTEEAVHRSRLYEEEQQRKSAETAYASREEFLRSCEMKLSVRQMAPGDVPRVRELMTRTHQLNTTGVLLSEEELGRILAGIEPVRKVQVAELSDRFGWCGVVGVALAEEIGNAWTLSLFALSCRVMGRGIERAFLAVLVREAMRRGSPRINALYRETGRNRMMRAMYQMAGFRQEGSPAGAVLTFNFQDGHALTIPQWVSIT